MKPLAKKLKNFCKNIVKKSPSTVVDTERLLLQLKRDEGVIYEIYEDSLGFKTFGIGHKITIFDPEYGKPVGTQISPDRVKEVFLKDVGIAIDDCRSIYGEAFKTWPSEVKEVLINMAFNLGRTRLSKFIKMHTALDSEDWKKAAEEGRDSLWYTQVPNRAERLMSRLEKVT